MEKQEGIYMTKAFIRNLLATLTIIVVNVVILITQQNKFATIDDEIASFAAIIFASTIISGILGGIIAPYTYKRVILYVEIVLALCVLIGGIILFAMGQEIGNTGSALGELALIIIIVILAVAILVFGIVSSIGFFLGTFIGSKIGKSFTSNYMLNDDNSTNFGDTLFSSQI